MIKNKTDKNGNEYQEYSTYLIDIGNYIFFSKELLYPKYEGYSTSYVFGDLNNNYGKNNIELIDVDVIKVMTNDKYIYLKRLLSFLLLLYSL